MGTKTTHSGDLPQSTSDFKRAGRVVSEGITAYHNNLSPQGPDLSEGAAPPQRDPEYEEQVNTGHSPIHERLGTTGRNREFILLRQGKGRSHPPLRRHGRGGTRQKAVSAARSTLGSNTSGVGMYDTGTAGPTVQD